MSLNENETVNEKENAAAETSAAEAAPEAKKKKRHKALWIILGAIAGVICVIAVIIGIYANKNVKEMNKCVDEIIAAISENHVLTAVDTGEFAEMKVYGIIRIQSEQYDIEGIGNLSLMKVNAGIMQMATAVISPADKDLPLLSCDYMYILGNRAAYIEQYDVCEARDDAYNAWTDRLKAVFADYSDLTDTQGASGWYDSILTAAAYKKTKPADDGKIIEMLRRSMDLCMDQADEYPALSADQIPAKLDRIKSYSDRLIDEGGVSTNFFVSAFGEDKTRSFFDEVFFGTKKYR